MPFAAGRNRAAALAIEPGTSYHATVNWPVLILYGGPPAAVVAGAALGYRTTRSAVAISVTASR
jgi:hypothetical protein